MSSEGAKPEHLSGAISFKNIKFAYPSRPNLYIYGGPQAPEGLNLEVKAGETAAMVSLYTMLCYVMLACDYYFNDIHMCTACSYAR
jgi:hypothetical protein